MNEIYPNPTLKQVIFQIRFPNLLYLENKIGDFQYSIMEKFPESSEIHRRRVFFAEIGPDAVPDSYSSEDQKGQKIWQFKDTSNNTLSVLTNSLDIASESYKTYSSEDVEYCFRDTIEFVLDKFFQHVRIPLIKRIGLRYVDLCPLPKKLTNTSFKKYYNTSFPLHSFNVQDAKSMSFKTTTKRGSYAINFAEELSLKGDEGFQYLLDFDGFAENITSGDCLTTADNLHNLIHQEFERIIKDPVRKIMRDGQQ